MAQSRATSNASYIYDTSSYPGFCVRGKNTGTLYKIFLENSKQTRVLVLLSAFGATVQKLIRNFSVLILTLWHVSVMIGMVGARKRPRHPKPFEHVNQSSLPGNRHCATGILREKMHVPQ
jgi:hypothetical protein